MASSSSKQVTSSRSANLQIKSKTIIIPSYSFEVQIESPVDFASLNRNGMNLDALIAAQEMFPYFHMLNGPTYVELVKDFWIRAEVYDEEAAINEELKVVTQDPSFRRKEPRSPRFEMLLGKLLFVKSRRG